MAEQGMITSMGTTETITFLQRLVSTWFMGTAEMTSLRAGLMMMSCMGALVTIKFWLTMGMIRSLARSGTTSFAAGAEMIAFMAGTDSIPFTGIAAMTTSRVTRLAIRLTVATATIGLLGGGRHWEPMPARATRSTEMPAMT